MKDRRMFFLIFICAFSVSIFNICSYDIFWHLKIGELIVKTCNILDINRFSWTYPDYNWIPTYWLFELIVFLVFKVFGFSGIVIFKALVIAVTYGILYYVFGRNINKWIILIIFFGVLDLSLFRFILRPHIFSYLGMSVLLLLIGRLNKKGKRDYYKFFILFMIWANVHSGVVFGFAYLFIYLFCERRKSLFLLVVCLCAALINPNGYNFFIYVFDHLSMDLIIPLEEFAPLSFFVHTKHALIVSGYILIPFLLLLKNKKLRFFNAGTVILSVFLLFKGIRFIPVVLIINMNNLSESLSIYFQNRKYDSFILQSILTVLFVCNIHLRVFSSHESYFKSGFGIHEGSFPVKAVLKMEPENCMRLYNSFTVGGYIIWYFDEKVKVFQDGRIHAYPSCFFVEIRKSSKNKKNWITFLERYDIINMLLDKSEEPSFKWESIENWNIVYEDDNFVYLKKNENF